MGCRAARDLQSGIVEAKSSTAKADTSGTGFGVSPVTVADFTVQCLLLGALAQRFPNERSVVRTRRPRSGRAGHPSARGALPPAHGGSLSRKSRATASWAPQCSSPGGCLSEAPFESPALAAYLGLQDPNPRAPDPTPNPNPAAGRP